MSAGYPGRAPRTTIDRHTTWLVILAISCAIAGALVGVAYDRTGSVWAVVGVALGAWIRLCYSKCVRNAASSEAQMRDAIKCFQDAVDNATRDLRDGR